MARSFDTVVIGGGPGGYVAAIKLGQLGVKAALIEKGDIGGVCLNWGCIPSKALIHVAQTVSHLADAKQFGVTASYEIDIEKTRAWKDEIVGKLTGGVRQLVKGNGCEIIEGKARFESSRSLVVEAEGGELEKIEFERCILATGAKSIEIPGFAVDGELIWGAQHAVDIPSIPDSMMVVGGGVIGLELGTVYAKLGTKVTVVEMMDGVLTGVDRDLSRAVERNLKSMGVRVLTKAKAKSLEKTEGGLRAVVEVSGQDETIECDRVLIAAGFLPSSGGVGLEAAGVETGDRGAIIVDETLQTNVPGIYAVGDVTGAPYLAHRAFKMGEVAAEHASGAKVAYEPSTIPAAIYTHPEIATTGISEEQARAEGREIKVGKFMLGANGRALGSAEPNGFVKVIVDEASGKLLGAGIAGYLASELISELTLGIEMGAMAEDIGLTVHPHPSLSEAVQEAALAALGKAVHAMNTRSREGGRRQGRQEAPA